MKIKTYVLLAAAVVLAVGTCQARPHRHHHRHCAPRHHHHHHHHHRGSAFLGGVVGGILYNAVTPRTVVTAPAPVVVQPAPVVVQSAPVVVQPAPVVVNQPVYQTQNVWVEGAYQDQVQANGTVLRVWVPGHYEQRTVQVQ